MTARGANALADANTDPSIGGPTVSVRHTKATIHTRKNTMAHDSQILGRANMTHEFHRFVFGFLNSLAHSAALFIAFMEGKHMM